MHPPEPRRGYLASHWRGELSLPVSFWVNNLLLSMPLALALGALTTWIVLKGGLLHAGSIAVLVGWPLLLLLDTWCIVGAWRSASRHVGRGGSRFWALAAQAVLAFGAVSTVASTAFDFVPQIGNYLQMARGIDPLGNLAVALSADGRRLQLKGPVGMGDGERVRQVLAGAASVRIVELDSPGGRLLEADRIAAAVRQRAAQTRATGPCESACTLVFMAGATRHVLPGAVLGFHRASSGTVNPVLDELANRELARIYRSAGLPEDFIGRTLKTPPSLMWRPPLEELAAGGVVSPLQRTLDVDLPAAEGALPVDLVDALRPNAAWHALDQRYPGSIEAAAAGMQATRQQGLSDDEAQVAAQRVVEPLLPRLLASAGPELREQYLALLADQLQAARATNTCPGVLAGDAAVRRRLPPPVVMRETAWLASAAGETGRDTAARAPTALELEVMRRTLGERAPALLMGLRAPQRADGGARGCDAAIALLREVLALPAAQRRLAARLLLERP